MIKPTYLWALCKTCRDSKWIGDICRALGGQDVQLDFGQRQVADMIKMDSDWMDERINWNREAARMRQARARERRKALELKSATDEASQEVTPVTRDNGVSREVTPASLHPSIHPSVHPSIGNMEEDNVIPPPPPTRGQADAAAVVAGYKPDEVDRWWRHCEKMDWHFSSGGRITVRNFRTSMKRFIEKDRMENRAAAPAATVTDADRARMRKLDEVLGI